jgi:hypothetical protein
MPRGDVLRHHPTDRESDHVEVVDAQRVDQRDRVVGEVFDGRVIRIVARRRVGQPVAAHIVAQHAVLPRQSVYLLVPHMHVGRQRVRQQHDRRVVRAREVVVNGQVVRADERHRRSPCRGGGRVRSRGRGDLLRHG